jgi:hypothetical protein
MTLLPSSLTRTDPSADVVWRRLRPRLWVGRVDGEHLGMIERGRRYTVTDGEGRSRGAYRTLESAQTALTGPVPIVAPAAGTRRSRSPLAAWTTAAMVLAFLLAMGALALLR